MNVHDAQTIDALGEADKILGDGDIAKIRGNPASVYSGDVDVGRLLAELRRRVLAEPVDLSTAKGRDAVISAAAKVSKTKTILDGAGKELTEKWRRQTDAVNAVRKRIRDTLDALRDEVRAPVTRWEEQEAARRESHKALIASISADATVGLDETAADVHRRIAGLESHDLSPAALQEFAEVAQAKRESTIAALRAALARLQREESDRAELARLRREVAEREERDRQGREAREKAERDAAAEQERAERERQAAAERERIAREAAERATREAEERHARELAAAQEKARREAAEAAAAAERERQRILDAQAVAEAKRRAEEKQRADEAAAAAQAEAARQADREHRAAVITAAANAIMEAGGISDARARKIVQAIASGGVPHVSVRF